jgi:integrase
VVNSPAYRARPTATFTQFSERWKLTVLTQHKPSSQAAEKSDLKAWTAVVGSLQMKDITGELLQSVVASWKGKLSPKTIRNRVMTFRILWKSAKAWQYVLHDPCDSLVLPDWDRPEQASFSVEDVKRIIAETESPYDVVFWLCAETGIRRGEVCALNVGHVDLEHHVIVVRDSRWNQIITANKSRKPRVFSLSPQLAERLKTIVEGRNAEEPLFVTPLRQTKTSRWIGGVRLHPDNFVKRHLKPILTKLGLKGAMHAFRHGNATALDQLNAPMKVRQERLGHVDARTTMDYTHLVSADDKRIAAELGGFFAQVCSKTETAQEV